MDSLRMRNPHEGHRIQNNQGRARSYPGTTFRGFVFGWKESYKQYRTGFSESEFTDRSIDEVVESPFRKEIQRTPAGTSFITSRDRRFERWSKMSRRREYIKVTEFDPNSTPVRFYVVKNENGNSDITSSEVVDFAAQLFYLASKRGRVKSTAGEVFHDEI